MRDKSLESQLKEMIVERLMLQADPSKIGDEDDLIQRLNLESVQLMEIVIGLEERFGVELGDQEFSVQKFRTVASIAEVVRNKKPDAGA
jgi:acyl carrier protein